MIKKNIKKFLAFAAQKFTRFCVYKGCMTQDEVIEKLSSYVDVKTRSKTMRFFCPGQIPIWRANTFYEKEPETVDWIDSFKNNSIFFDVGANVGLYSIYAGINNHTVLAIEPMADNYFILQKNVNINKLQNVSAYCACLYDKMLIDTLKIRNDGYGQAENSFDEPVGTFEEYYKPLYLQGVIGLPLDHFSEKIGFPRYIKIDVDGHELKVLHGSSKTLSHPELKSILIELNSQASNYQEICSLIKKHGFTLQKKTNGKMFNETKYRNVENHIFSRT